MQIFCQGGDQLLVGRWFLAAGEKQLPHFLGAVFPGIVGGGADRIFYGMPIAIAKQLRNIGIQFLGKALNISLGVSVGGDEQMGIAKTVGGITQLVE